jgi:NAD(P)H-dependent flavin oxidoreductase YrpB (nitropropane dioxygenase family)
MTAKGSAPQLAGRVPILVLFWGDPAPFVDQTHAVGTKVFIQSGSVDEARHAAEVGVDAVIAQGVEAGGHVRATQSRWHVVPHWAGTSASTVNDIKPAAEIVRALVRETEAALAGS